MENFKFEFAPVNKRSSIGDIFNISEERIKELDALTKDLQKEIGGKESYNSGDVIEGFGNLAKNVNELALLMYWAGGSCMLNLTIPSQAVSLFSQKGILLKQLIGYLNVANPNEGDANPSSL